MSNKLLFNKKTLFFVFCFFVFSFIFLGIKPTPTEAISQEQLNCIAACNAAGGPCGAGKPTGPNTPCFACLSNCAPANVYDTSGNDPDACLWHATEYTLAGYTKYTIGAIANVLQSIPKALAYLATELSNWIISNVLNWGITRPDPGTAAVAFVEGWRSVRDVANMAIVLGFVFVGIATALRLRDYEAKKFLLPLIIAALFINFSGLIVGLFIDASRFIMTGLAGTTSGGMGTQFYTSLSELNNAALCKIANAAGGVSILNYIVTSAQFTVIFTIVGLSFLFLAGVLIIRFAALGILFMLSPIAFVFRAFPLPKVKSVWERWLNSFLKWIFIGVILCFFIGIAARVADTVKSQMYSLDNTVLFSYLFVIIALLIAGLFSAIKGSGAVGGALSAIGGMVGGFALGGAKLAGRGADALSGGRISGAGRAISSGAGRALEKMGLRARGSTAQRAQSQMKDVAGRVGSMNEDDLIKTATGRAHTARGRDEKASAIQRLIKDGKINKLGDTRQQGDSIAYAEGHLGSRSIDTENLKKEARKQNPNLAVTSRGIAEAVRTVAPVKAAEWDPKIVTAAVAANISANQAKEIGSKGAPELVNKLRAIKWTSGVALPGQSAECKQAVAHILSTTTRGSAERIAAVKRFSALQKTLQTDQNFA